MRHQKQIILHRFIRCQVNLPAGQPVFKPVYNGNRMKLQKDLFIFDTLKLFDLDLMPAYQFFNQLANLFFKNLFKSILTGNFKRFQIIDPVFLHLT